MSDRAPDDTATVPPVVSLDSNTTVAPAPAAPAAAVAQAVPGYELLGELGRGGMGVVYKARQVGLNRLCALKMILSGGHASAADLARFRSEAEAVARLQHPGIVAIYEIGTHDGVPFFSLELCSGGSLDKKLGGTPLEPREAAKLVKALAEAMQTAHEAKVVHRDLKPANVLLGADGTAKITDFGLAKKLDEASQTQTGAVMGTPSYMAPEQASGSKEVGPLADVYALGAILYDCLTGRPPFKAATALDTVLQVVSEEPVPPRSLNAKVPADVETITLKCLQKDARRRYATARELAADLGRWLAGEAIVARPVGAVTRAAKWVRRNRAVSAMAAAVFVALSGGLAASLWQMDRANREAGRADEKATEAENNSAIAKREKARAEKQLERAEGLVYAGKLSLAQSAILDGNVISALNHLNDCQWDRRGWEHRYLWTCGKTKQNFVGHTGDVTSVAYRADGKQLVSGSEDKTVRVWDAETGREVLALKGHTERVTSVTFTPDGRRIISGGDDQTVMIWDAKSGRQIHALRGHLRGVSSVAITADGRRIVSGSQAWDAKGKHVVDAEVKLWSAESGKEVRAFKAGINDITSVAVSPDGQRIVASSRGGVMVWDAQTGRLIWENNEHFSTVFSVAMSPAGDRILSGSRAGEMKVWDAATGRELLSVEVGTDHVRCVAFSPDGLRIACATEDKVKVYSADKGREIVSLAGHMGDVLAVAFSADGRRLVSGGRADHLVIAWNAETGLGPRSFRGQSGCVFSVAVRPDGKQIISGNDDSTVRIWDAESGQEVRALREHHGPVRGVAFSPDGKRLATASADRTVKVWDAETGQLRFSLDGHAAEVNSVAFSPDGRRIISGSSDKTIKVWDAGTGKNTLTLEGHTKEVVSVAYSPDGKRLASGCLDKTVKVWGADTGNLIHTLEGHTDEVSCVAFRPDSQRVVSSDAGYFSTLKVWDIRTGKEVLSLQGDNNNVSAVVYSPDGQRIFSAGIDKTVKVWHAETGQDLLTLKGPIDRVLCLAISPDGQRLISGDFENRVVLWSASKSQDVTYVGRHPSRVTSMAFSPDGQRLFTWDETKKARAWSMRSGQLIETDNPPTMPPPGPAVSPDGFLRAEPADDAVAITDKRLVNPKANHWPLPDAAERTRYHTEQARLAELHEQHFAAGFHLGRLLLDAPDDPDLKRRREAALKLHAAAAKAKQK